MGRLGLQTHEVIPFFNKLKGFKNIAVEGILTHLAEIDEDNKNPPPFKKRVGEGGFEKEGQGGFSRHQLGSFLKVIDTVKDMGFEPIYRHVANSAAIVNIPETHFNLVRPGIMLYGVYPAEKLKEKISLKPVLELKTRIVQLKKLSKGKSVSYGRTFTAKRESVIAVVPIGYGDGYPRHLSNKGEMLVHGKRARVAGVVCMDLTMLDVTDINNVHEGDEVTIIGRDGKEEIAVEEVAEKAGTIPYEILCNIGKRVPHLYIN